MTGGFNRFEKYKSNFIISPDRVDHNKYLKPPPTVDDHCHDQNFPSKLPVGEICTSKAVWLKDRRARPETKPDDSQKAMSKDIWMFPKIVGCSSQIIHGLLVFFSLFSPSILGCFPLFLGTPIFVYGPLSCASRGVVILRKFFSPRIPVTQVSLASRVFLNSIPIMLEGSSPPKKT